LYAIDLRAAAVVPYMYQAATGVGAAGAADASADHVPATRKAAAVVFQIDNRPSVPMVSRNVKCHLRTGPDRRAI
jgi:hypothetical protein